MKIKIKNAKISIEDIIMLIIVVFTLAFHNYTLALAAIQLSGCFLIYLFELSKGKIDKLKYKYALWMILFIIICASSYMWATTNTHNVIITTRSMLQVAMVGFSVVLYVDSDEKTNKFIKYIIIGSIILVGRLLIEVPTYSWGTERVGNYIGYGNNSAPLVLSYAAIMVFFLFQNNKKIINLIESLIFIVFSLLCGSKKAILISILGIGMLIVVKAKNPLQIIRKIIVVLIIVVIMYLSIMKIESLYNVLGNRVESMMLALTGQTGGDMSTLDRMTFAKEAYNVFKTHPLLGVGLDNYRYYNYMNYYAHNNYLELAADLGVVGFMIYYIMPFHILIGSFKNKKKNYKFMFIFIILLVILLMDIANVSFETDSVQLYLAFIYSIYICTLKKQEVK